jgi:hypothetical protein
MSLAIKSTSKRKAQMDLDEMFKSADGKRNAGRKPYWQHVVTVKDHHKHNVFYQCKLCGKKLSTRNPHDSVASHIMFTADGATCKAHLSLQDVMQAAQEHVVGASLSSNRATKHNFPSKIAYNLTLSCLCSCFL